MAVGTRYPIVLDPVTQGLLIGVRNSRKAAVRDVRTANILLDRALGIQVRTIARRLRCGTATIAKTCRRFLEGGWELGGRERPRGRPRCYPQAQVEQVQGWAQTAPQAHELPVTRWSLAWFQELWRSGQSPKPPARSTLRRWCQAADLAWYRIRSWCTSNDPDYLPKLTAVCDAYLKTPPKVAVLCYDQKPHIQALARRVPNRPPEPGKPGRQEHDYLRRGTIDLHALYDTRSGQSVFACRPNHKQDTIAAFLLDALSQRPESEVLLITDNLNANHAPAVTKALTRLAKECCKTVTVLCIPTHSSWANQVERLFADVQRELLDHLEAESTEALQGALGQWFHWRNAHPKPFEWKYHPDSALRRTGH
jgi:transposase